MEPLLGTGTSVNNKGSSSLLDRAHSPVVETNNKHIELIKNKIS